MMKEHAAELNWYLSNFRQFENNVLNKTRLNHHDIRRNAISQFVELGFPNTRQENWRFTNVSAIARTRFKPVLFSENIDLKKESLDSLFIGDQRHIQLVFINGQFAASLSSPIAANGIHLSPLSEALVQYPERVNKHLAQYIRFEGHSFAALNTAFWSDGGFIYIPDNTIFAPPIHLVFLTHPGAEPVVTHPRNLLIIGENSRATIIESYLSARDGVYFTNPVTELVLEENAVVDHYKMQQESEQAYHVALQQSLQKRNSNLQSQSFSFGAAITRNNVNAVLDGEGSETTLNGLYMQHGKQHVDNHTLIEHAQPHCFSRELYKGILKGHARAVFNGRIHVRQDAQKTDAIQSNQNLLLSEDATVNTQPQLEIYADDVRCTHGGTIGQMDEQGVFYLRSRGISEAKARSIMIYAFASDVTDRIKVDTIREWVDKRVLQHLDEKILLKDVN